MLIKYVVVVRHDRRCWLSQHKTELAARHAAARDTPFLAVERWSYPVLADGTYGEPVKVLVEAGEEQP